MAFPPNLPVPRPTKLSDHPTKRQELHAGDRVFIRGRLEVMEDYRIMYKPVVSLSDGPVLGTIRLVLCDRTGCLCCVALDHCDPEIWIEGSRLERVE